MLRSRLLRVTSLCVAYLLLSAFVPIIEIHHGFEIGLDGTNHQAIDTCTWLDHVVGSTVFSGAEIHLNPLTLQVLVPHHPDELYRSTQLCLIKARAPPTLVTYNAP